MKKELKEHLMKENTVLLKEREYENVTLCCIRVQY
jgi:hypothetical protein